MKEYDFLKNYVVPEGTVVRRNECKYRLYPVSEATLLEAEQQLNLRLPEQLRKFYLNIGYGYIGQDSVTFLNKIMHPLEIVKLKRGLDYYGNMDTEDFDYYTSDDVLTFFDLGGEFDYLVMQMKGPNRNKIIYFGEYIADDFDDFIKKMCKKTDYYLDFDH